MIKNVTLHKQAAQHSLIHLKAISATYKEGIKDFFNYNQRPTSQTARAYCAVIGTFACSRVGMNFVEHTPGLWGCLLARGCFDFLKGCALSYREI